MSEEPTLDAKKNFCKIRFSRFAIHRKSATRITLIAQRIRKQREITGEYSLGDPSDQFLDRSD